MDLFPRYLCVARRSTMNGRVRARQSAFTLSLSLARARVSTKTKGSIPFICQV